MPRTSTHIEVGKDADEEEIVVLQLTVPLRRIIVLITHYTNVNIIFTTYYILTMHVAATLALSAFASSFAIYVPIRLRPIGLQVS